MARTPLSFEDYFENAFLDAARSGWAEDYDNNFDLFTGKTFTVGPTNADYLTVDDAIDAAPADDHVLYLLQTGSYAGLAVGKSLNNKKIVFAPLSTVYGDVVFNSTTWANVFVINSTIIFDKIKFDTNTAGSIAFYNDTIGAFSRILYNGCYVRDIWISNTSAKLLTAGVTQGSTASTGTELSRFTFLACTANHPKVSTGVFAAALTAGNYKYEFRRTVYNQVTIKDLESSYVPAFDIEDLVTVESGTHGADAALSVLPLPPDTLAYALDTGLTFSNPLSQADLITYFYENISVDDNHFYEWFRAFMDTIRITDGLGILEVFYEKFDTVDFSNSSKLVVQALTEALSFTVLMNATQSFALREVMNLSQAELTELTTAKIINDSFDIVSKLFAAFVENVIDNLQMDETIQDIPQRIRDIYEAMGISDDPHYASVFARNIAETINILDELGQAKGGTIAENINFSITALKIVLSSILTDIYHTTSSTNNALTISVVHADSFILDETFDLNAILNSNVADNAIFSIGIPVSEDEYATYVLNTETAGISEYTNFPFNSISGEYAATSTGIYKLTGDTDDGAAIISSIKTGLMDFGTSIQKQIPYAYIGCDTSGKLVLKTTTTHKGVKKERWYSINQTRLSVDTVKLKLGKGIKSTYYQFELVAIDGASFSVDTIELLPITLKRRI